MCPVLVTSHPGREGSLCVEAFSGRFRAVPKRVQAECFRLFGREDEGYFRRPLAVFAPHRDLGTAARMRPCLIPRRGFGGATVGAGKVFVPRDLCRAASLFARERHPNGSPPKPCQQFTHPPEHSRPCTSMQVPEYQDARVRVPRPASRGTAQERWPSKVQEIAG